MKIPDDAIIPDEKFLSYLLLKRDFDDKSQFLNRAGYTIDNFKLLIDHIREMIRNNNAHEDKIDDYGIFYKVNGYLPGTDSNPIFVSTVWMRKAYNGKFYFITLYPGRRK